MQNDATGLRDFLRHYPLFQRFSFTRARRGPLDEELPESAAFPCECTTEKSTSWNRNFTIGLGTSHDERNKMMLGPFSGVYVTYTCALCKKKHRYFWLSIQVDKEATEQSDTETILTAYKIGQYPEPDISVPRPVKRELSRDELEFYRKAVVSLEHSFGLGAVAYFRRLLENAGNKFLDLIEEEAELEGNADLKRRVEEARSGTAVGDRLKVASDLLPSSLRPGGINPLALMYGILSENLHSKTDSECQAEAYKLRGLFDYVFENLYEHVRRAREMGEKLRRSSR